MSCHDVKAAASLHLRGRRRYMYVSCNEHPVHMPATYCTGFIKFLLFDMSQSHTRKCSETTRLRKISVRFSWPIRTNLEKFIWHGASYPTTTKKLVSMSLNLLAFCGGNKFNRQLRRNSSEPIAGCNCICTCNCDYKIYPQDGSYRKLLDKPA